MSLSDYDPLDFQHDVEHRSPTVPERRLVAALIKRSVLDAIGGGWPATTKSDLKSARFWLFCDPDTRHPWGFEWACALLDLDPDRVRHAVRHNDGLYGAILRAAA